MGSAGTLRKSGRRSEVKCMGNTAEDDEQRKHLRHPLTGDLTGSMISAATGSKIPCIAVDVSASGMKIVLTLDLDLGTKLFLRLMNQREVPLEVVWCRKEPSRKGYFACGLRRVDEKTDLERVFTEAGWFDNP